MTLYNARKKYQGHQSSTEWATLWVCKVGVVCKVVPVHCKHSKRDGEIGMQHTFSNSNPTLGPTLFTTVCSSIPFLGMTFLRLCPKSSITRYSKCCRWPYAMTCGMAGWPSDARRRQALWCKLGCLMCCETCTFFMAIRRGIASLGSKPR
jgi:hypothetical protein